MEGGEGHVDPLLFEMEKERKGGGRRGEREGRGTCGLFFFFNAMVKEEPN